MSTKEIVCGKEHMRVQKRERESMWVRGRESKGDIMLTGPSVPSTLSSAVV